MTDHGCRVLMRIGKAMTRSRRESWTAQPSTETMADARQRDAGATNPTRAQASAAHGGCGKVAERIEAWGAARSARDPGAVPGSGSRAPLEFDWEQQTGTALQEPGNRWCGIPARKDSEVIEGGCMARVRSTAPQPMTCFSREWPRATAEAMADARQRDAEATRRARAAVRRAQPERGVAAAWSVRRRTRVSATSAGMTARALASAAIIEEAERWPRESRPRARRATRANLRRRPAQPEPSPAPDPVLQKKGGPRRREDDAARETLRSMPPGSASPGCRAAGPCPPGSP